MSVLSPFKSPIRSSTSVNRDAKKISLLKKEIVVNNEMILNLNDEINKLKEQATELNKQKSVAKNNLKSSLRLLKMKENEIEDEFNVKKMIVEENGRMKLSEIAGQKNAEKKQEITKLHEMTASIRELYMSNSEKIKTSIQNYKVWCYKSQVDAKIKKAVEERPLTEAEQLNMKLKSTLHALKQSTNYVPQEEKDIESKKEASFETAGTNVRYTRYVVEKPFIVSNSN